VLECATGSWNVQLNHFAKREENSICHAGHGHSKFSLFLPNHIHEPLQQIVDVAVPATNWPPIVFTFDRVAWVCDALASSEDQWPKICTANLNLLMHEQRHGASLIQRLLVGPFCF